MNEPSLFGDYLLKTIAHWLAILGTTIGALFAFVLVYNAYASDRVAFRTMLTEHVRAMVGIPMAAASSFCVVMLLEATSGTIEFKALGFEFHGASGPVVLWIFAFLAFCGAIRLLW
jgi:hypothetical protein